MNGYTLSRRAEQDLDAIASYTRDRWGTKQAIRYIKGLRAPCQQLAVMPEIGRPSGDIRSRLRRMEGGRHIVFYRISADGIRVTRILHQRMLPELHDS